MIQPGDVARYFASDYGEARSRFCYWTQMRGFELTPYMIGQTGPHREELSIDVARIGDAVARSVVVVSSGLHGVEGYFGAAVQMALLQDDNFVWDLPRDVALVMIHALNPWGFAWNRRADEENVDLNRNFLLPGEPYKGSPPRYAALDALLNPKHPPRRLDSFKPRAMLSILRHGMPQLKQAVAGGQYDFPQGLFFGGAKPSFTYRILSEFLPRWVGDASRIVHFDFHTGLGRRATYRLLVDVGLEQPHFEWSRAHFGAHVVHSDPARSIAYQARGDLAAWCRSAFPDRSYELLCAEFGTYPPLRVLAALRAENQAHFWAKPDQPITPWAKRQLLEAFVPSSPRWRASAVTQGLELVKQGVRACSSAPSP
jgi:hypothetical protein